MTRTFLLALACCCGCAASGTRYPMAVERGGADTVRAVVDLAEGVLPTSRGGDATASRLSRTNEQRAVSVVGMESAQQPGAGDAASPPVALPKYAVAAAADSLTLRWHAPAYLRGSCEADPTRPAHDRQVQRVWRVNTVQPPFYRRGIEASMAGWDSVRAFNVPVLACTLLAWPGAACSTRVAAGAYRVTACNGAGCGCESAVVTR